MLGFLLFGTVLAGSAIKCGYDNFKAMEKPSYYLDDGTPVYRNRKSEEIVNGERMYVTSFVDDYGHDHTVLKGVRTQRIYIDYYEKSIRPMLETSEKNKQEAIEKGQLAYMKWNELYDDYLTTEIETGLPIAELEGREDGTYWKYYLFSDSRFIPRNMKREWDKGIQITQEEYDKLNIGCPELNWTRSHYALDYNREVLVYNKIWKTWLPEPIQPYVKKKNIRTYEYNKRK